MEHSIAVQRLEAGFIFAASAFIYFHFGFSLLYFLLILFLFDVFMTGYLFGNRTGAYIYNLGHSFILPAVLLAIGILSGSRMLTGLSLIWLCHIGMDRMMGYGLKRTTTFTDTHLGPIGKRRSDAGSG